MAEETKAKLEQVEKEVKPQALATLRGWGESSISPAILATLITAQHLQPFRALPMLFPPIFMGASYVNLNGYKKDAAGFSAAWSALYLLLARRRRQTLSNRFSVRGVVRGSTMGLCLAQMVAGGYVYATTKREEGSI